MAISAVMFDAAGVLTEPFSPELAGPAIEAGADPNVLVDVLVPLFSAGSDNGSVAGRVERGEANMEELFEALGSDGVHARMVIDPASPTYFGHTWRPDLEMRDFVREVHAAGFATALVTNNAREWQDLWDRIVPEELPFDARVFSWQVGSRKPEPEIYHIAAESLGVPPAEVLFMDDFEAMVVGARQVGMTAVHVADTTTSILEARALLGL
ncbi:MAG: HAD-IA family hydrolase [Acidimicrobiales bacterium]